VLAILLTAGVFLWHARETLIRFPLGAGETRSLPFLQDDHPLHFYYSQLTLEFFTHRRAFWGYDPTFMAGSSKTIIFPTSSTLHELAAIVAGPSSAIAYRVSVAAAIFLTPFFIAFAARGLAGTWSAWTTAFWIGVVWVWCGWPATYVAWGMGGFIAACAISIWSAALLAGWFDSERIGALIRGALLAAVAIVIHPLSLIVLAASLVPAYLVRLRAMSWRSHVATWGAAAVVVLAWSPWWLPALALRESYGSSAIGFVNENVRGRMIELATAKFPEESALLLAAVVASLRLWGLGPARFACVIGGAAALFALAYFGSVWKPLWSLQPGRFTQPLYALLVVLIAVGVPRWLANEAGTRWTSGRWLGLVLCGLAALLIAPKLVGRVLMPARPLVGTVPPANLLALAVHLRDHTDQSGRILFEDRGRLNLGPFDPFPGTNPSALLPLLAPGQYIGGPYLYAAVKSNFTQCGDGFFFGHPVESLDIATFQRYARLYNIRWAVLRSCPFTAQELIARGALPDVAVQWSAPLGRMAQSYPDYFRHQARFGYVDVYELNQSPNWAIIGSAQALARPDHIDVTEARPAASGRLVLSYHWVPTLRSSVPLTPEFHEDDPVPFIAVQDPPENFSIENR
jgi:hypothetical protein